MHPIVAKRIADEIHDLRHQFVNVEDGGDLPAYPSASFELKCTALQGIGAGGLLSLPMAIVGDILPPAERAKYQGYFLAVFSHALWNSVGVYMVALLLISMGHELGEEAIPSLSMWFSSSVANLVVESFAYLVLIILLYLSAQWERAIIRRYLADELGTGSVTPEEYAQIIIDRPFGRVFRRTHANKERNKAIINAQNELAFRKWHLDRDHKDAANDALVAAWRDDIDRLRAG